MTLAIDASTPAQVSGTGAVQTTASFTPPLGAVLVACAGGDGNTNGHTLTITDSQSGTWEQVHQDGPTNSGHAQIALRRVTTSAAMTVTVTNSETTAQSTALKVWVVTGNSVTWGTVIGGSTTTSSPATLSGLTTTRNNSFAFWLANNFGPTTTPSSTDLTASSGYNAGPNFISGLSGYKLVPTAGATTANYTEAGASPQLAVLAVEVYEGLVVTPVLVATQAANAGSNATEGPTTASRTWSTGELIIGCWGTVQNSGGDWTITSLDASGGSISLVSINAALAGTGGGGYRAGNVIAVYQVTTGWTGTITFNRTNGTTDHWDAGSVYVVTGHDTTTPVRQIATTNLTIVGSSPTSISPTMPAAPLTTSVVFSSCIVDPNASGSTTFTAPTGMTGTSAIESGTNYGPFGSAYKLGSGSAANTWTIPNGTTAAEIAAMSIEIVESLGVNTNVFPYWNGGKRRI